MTKTTRSLVIVTAAAALALAGCSSAKDKDSTESSSSTVASSSAKATTSSKASTTATSTTAAASHDHQGEFHLHDGYVKAAKAGGMTAIFGILENHADKPAHLVSFTSSANAKMNQIHEVVDGKMQEKKGGIVVPADSQFILKPGGDHLMLMGLPTDLDAGSKISVTLKFEDGKTVTIKDVPVRQIAAGNESYSGDMKMEHKDGDMKMEHKDGDMKMDGGHADHTITQETPAEKK